MENYVTEKESAKDAPSPSLPPFDCTTLQHHGGDKRGHGQKGRERFNSYIFKRELGNESDCD